MGGQTPEPNRPVEECEEDNPDRRIHWQIFIGSVIGMALLAAFAIATLNVVRANHRQDEISRRQRYEACRSLENEISRTFCLQGTRG